MVELTKMDVHGTGPAADTETVLTVKYGTILYSVRKLSANSRYEVHTPNGVAAVRGTDFQVTVTTLATGKVRVSYTCVTGQLLVSADVDGQIVTKVLATSQQWVPGEGDVVILPPGIGPGMLPSSPAVPPPPPVVPPPVVLQQPFSAGAAPNPAVDLGQNPYQRSAPLPIPDPRPMPGPLPIPQALGRVQSRSLQTVRHHPTIDPARNTVSFEQFSASARVPASFFSDGSHLATRIFQRGTSGHFFNLGGAHAPSRRGGRRPRRAHFHMEKSWAEGLK